MVTSYCKYVCILIFNSLPCNLVTENKDIYIYIYELKLRSYGPGQCTKVFTGYIKHSIIIENESEHTIYWCITPNYLIDIRR